jgi:hypothetical protein
MRLLRAVVDLAHNRTHCLLLLVDLRAACAKLGLVARALLFELELALAQPAPLVVAWLRLFDLVLLTLDLAPKLPKLEKLLAVLLELQRLLRLLPQRNRQTPSLWLLPPCLLVQLLAGSRQGVRPCDCRPRRQKPHLQQQPRRRASCCCQ